MLGAKLFYLLALVASIAMVRYFDAQDAPVTHSKLSIYGSFGIFAVGIVAYHMFRQDSILRNRLILSRATAVAALALGAFLGWNNASFFYGEAAVLRGPGLSLELAWAPVFGLIVLSQALHPFSFISNRLFNHLGDLSFSIYLCHPPIIYFMKPVYDTIYASTSDLWSALFISAALTSAIVYAVSLTTFTFIERPGIAWGERIIRNRAQRPDSSRSLAAGDPLQ